MIQAAEEPLPSYGQVKPRGLFLIAGDRETLALEVAKLLEQQGATVALLPAKSLHSPQQIRDTIDCLRQNQGPLAGLVHLAAVDCPQPPTTLAQWRTFTQCHCKSLFHLLQSSGMDGQQPGRVLAASALGGYFGRQPSPRVGLPTGGSAIGLLKTLLAEWPQVQAKVIDLDLEQPPELMAQAIVSELLLDGGRTEVGYPAGKRTIFLTTPAPLPNPASPNLIPERDWVVLVTGGGKGITAKIAEDLAHYGLTLIVVGRSPVLPPEDLMTANLDEIKDLRQVFLQQAKKEGRTVTPVEIEQQVRQLLDQRTLVSNLANLQRAGAKVAYFALDVRDEIAFGGLIDQLYRRYGRLDAVIHGAGIIEDKLLLDKTPASFERVFDTKVDSTFLLSRYLNPAHLKLLVLFSSVAGRYGNRGQGDYGAANEVMNRLAWQLAYAWPQTRVVAINWGPWDTTGMASEEVKRQFRQRGILPISLEAGRQFFLEEVCYGSHQDTETIAGKGPWEEYEHKQGQRRQAHQEIALEKPIIASNISKWAFLPENPRRQADGSLTFEHVLSLANAPYLADHRLDGKPVLPATAALEWVAEMVQAGWPDWMVSEISHLRVLRGLVLDSVEGSKFCFQAKASSHADASALSVAVTIKESQGNLPCYRGTVILRLQLDSPPPNAFSPLKADRRLSPTQAYRDYLFHGPRFQLITEIEALAPTGVDAWVKTSQSSLWTSSPTESPRPWLFEPGLLDTAPQLAIVWARVYQNTTALPACLGEVKRYGSQPLPERLRLSLRVRRADVHSLTYEAIFSDAQGNIRFTLNDIESTCNSSLNRLASQS